MIFRTQFNRKHYPENYLEAHLEAKPAIRAAFSKNPAAFAKNLAKQIGERRLASLLKHN